MDDEVQPISGVLLLKSTETIAGGSGGVQLSTVKGAEKGVRSPREFATATEKVHTSQEPSPENMIEFPSVCLTVSDKTIAD